MHQPGIEPGPHAWEARILTIGPLVLTRLKRVDIYSVIISDTLLISIIVNEK